ncbi:unnamed protein product [Prorocentrum cordatum]|uniref:Glycerophosphocholine acyltransferase 1 n=1 Tax=Prorocentrum cordatum TaxID=2364126 RepID=A0ABN9XUT3_9DINO|nr:unnamed protein product [Polarella glacialis]
MGRDRRSPRPDAAGSAWRSPRSPRPDAAGSSRSSSRSFRSSSPAPRLRPATTQGSMLQFVSDAVGGLGEGGGLTAAEESAAYNALDNVERRADRNLQASNAAIEPHVGALSDRVAKMERSVHNSQAWHPAADAGATRAPSTDEDMGSLPAVPEDGDDYGAEAETDPDRQQAAYADFLDLTQRNINCVGVHAWGMSAATRQGATCCGRCCALVPSALLLLLQAIVLHSVSLEALNPTCVRNEDCPSGTWCSPSWSLGGYEALPGTCDDCLWATQLHETSSATESSSTTPTSTSHDSDFFKSDQQCVEHHFREQHDCYQHRICEQHHGEQQHDSSSTTPAPTPLFLPWVVKTRRYKARRKRRHRRRRHQHRQYCRWWHKAERGLDVALDAAQVPIHYAALPVRLGPGAYEKLSYAGLSAAVEHCAAHAVDRCDFIRDFKDSLTLGTVMVFVFVLLLLLFSIVQDLDKAGHALDVFEYRLQGCDPVIRMLVTAVASMNFNTRRFVLPGIVVYAYCALVLAGPATPGFAQPVYFLFCGVFVGVIYHAERFCTTVFLSKGAVKLTREAFADEAARDAIERVKGPLHARALAFWDHRFYAMCLGAFSFLVVVFTETFMDAVPLLDVPRIFNAGIFKEVPGDANNCTNVIIMLAVSSTIAVLCYTFVWTCAYLLTTSCCRCSLGVILAPLNCIMWNVALWMALWTVAYAPVLKPT